MLDLDPYQMNMDPKPCFIASKLKKVISAAWKPDPDPGIFGESDFRPSRPKCKEMALVDSFGFEYNEVERISFKILLLLFSCWLFLCSKLNGR
jgi:hypothetical protein